MRRRNVFLDILKIKDFNENYLKLFPTSWQLLLITSKYVSKVSPYLKPSLVKSLVLSKIVISYIDRKIGIVRTWKNFEKYKNYASSQMNSNTAA